MNSKFKFISEFGPLIAFFAAYKFYGLIVATSVLVAFTAAITAASYALYKKVSSMALITASVVALFGGLTIYSGNELFIKLKPTLVNLVFAAILLVGAARGKGLLKYLLRSAMQMSEPAWVKFSLRWAYFFLIMAAANEFVWRNFSTDIWVQFKVFGILGLTFVFVATQIPFIQKHSITEDKVK